MERKEKNINFLIWRFRLNRAIFNNSSTHFLDSKPMLWIKMLMEWMSFVQYLFQRFLYVLDNYVLWKFTLERKPHQKQMDFSWKFRFKMRIRSSHFKIHFKVEAFKPMLPNFISFQWCRHMHKKGVIWAYSMYLTTLRLFEKKIESINIEHSVWWTCHQSTYSPNITFSDEILINIDEYAIIISNINDS